MNDFAYLCAKINININSINSKKLKKMKKIIFTLCVGAVLSAGIILIGSYKTQSSDGTSYLTNTNVEALASGEEGGSCSASAYCFSEEYDFKTGTWVKTIIGNVGCTGTEECKSGSQYVMCDGTISSCD